MLFPNWKEMTEAMKHMQGGVGFAVPSELYLFCRSREGTELSDSVRDIKNSCIVVVGRVHSLQFRILVKHISLCLPAVVVDELATDANPLIPDGFTAVISNFGLAIICLNTFFFFPV